MNENMTNAALGVVGVVLAYALYSHFKKPAAAAVPGVRAPAPAKMAPQPAMGFAQGAPEYTGSMYTMDTDMLTGREYDAGAYQGANLLADISPPSNPYDGFRVKTPW